MSKIVRIILNFFFIEEYQFRGTFLVIDIFWKIQFLKQMHQPYLKEAYAHHTTALQVQAPTPLLLRLSYGPATLLQLHVKIAASGKYLSQLL